MKQLLPLLLLLFGSLLAAVPCRAMASQEQAVDTLRGVISDGPPLRATYPTEEGECVTITLPDDFRIISPAEFNAIFSLRDNNRISSFYKAFYNGRVGIVTYRWDQVPQDIIPYKRFRDLYPTTGWDCLEVAEKDFYFLCPFTADYYMELFPFSVFEQEAMLFLEKKVVGLRIYSQLELTEEILAACEQKTDRKRRKRDKKICTKLIDTAVAKQKKEVQQLLRRLIRQIEIDPGAAHPRSYKPER